MKSFPISSIAITIFLLAAVSACKPTPKNDLNGDQVRWVERTLQSMTTEQKVGQLLAPAIAPPRDESPVLGVNNMNHLSQL